MIYVITRSGDKVQGDSTSLGAYFGINEYIFQKNIARYGELVVCKVLMQVTNSFRFKIQEPLVISSFNRDDKKQEELNENPHYKAAKFSPHVVKLAADMVPRTILTLHDIWRESNYKNKQVRNAIKILLKKHYIPILEQSAKEIGVKIRIGVDEYLENDQSFIHMDICPEFYAEGKPWHNKTHPKVWEVEARW